MNWKKRTEWIDDAEKVRAARDPDETALDNARRQQGDTTGAVIEDGEVLFEVKKVVQLGSRKGKPYVKVQWAGWEGDRREYTWEPASYPAVLPRRVARNLHAEAAAATARKRPRSRGDNARGRKKFTYSERHTGGHGTARRVNSTMQYSI